MKTLGNIFIGLGLVLCCTVIFMIWGFILIGLGALLRIAGRP